MPPLTQKNSQILPRVGGNEEFSRLEIVGFVQSPTRTRNPNPKSNAFNKKTHMVDSVDHVDDCHGILDRRRDNHLVQWHTEYEGGGGWEEEGWAGRRFLAAGVGESGPDVSMVRVRGEETKVHTNNHVRESEHGEVLKKLRMPSVA